MIKIKLSSKKISPYVSLVTIMIVAVVIFPLFVYYSSSVLDSIMYSIAVLATILVVYWIWVCFKKDKCFSEILIYKDFINFVYKIPNEIDKIKKIDKNNIKSFNFYIKMYYEPYALLHYNWMRYSGIEPLLYDIYFTVRLYEGNTIKECICNIPFKSIMNIIKHCNEMPNFSYCCINNYHNIGTNINSFYQTGKKNLRLKYEQYPVTIMLLLMLLIFIMAWVWGYCY